MFRVYVYESIGVKLIPTPGTSFSSCYLLTGRDLQFAVDCLEILLRLNIKVQAVIGENSKQIKEQFADTEFSTILSSIRFDTSNRPWDSDALLEATSESGTLGINGGIEYLLPADFLENRILINLHPAPLPINRGSHHSFWAIMDDEPMGATLHWISEGLDEGPIIAKVTREILPSMTAAEVQKKSNQEAIALLHGNIEKIMSGRWSSSEQEGRTTKHFKIDIIAASTIEHNKQYSGEHILRLCRAVCNKRNGFLIRTKKEVYKIVVESIIPVDE